MAEIVSPVKPVPSSRAVQMFPILTPAQVARIVMTGAMPSTGWLDGCVALDGKGFIKTGPDLTDAELASANWPLARAPHLLETGLPGVFAVGEGAIAVAFVHQVLRE